MLEAYFDDSGTHNDSRVSVWAGFVASESQWTAFDADWRDLLKNPDFKLSYFHMYDVVHGDGECIGWEQGRRDHCIHEFREVILKHGLYGIGNSVPKKDWEEIALPSKLLSYPAEQFGLSACIPIARHHSMGKDDNMAFIFDDRQRAQPAVDSAINFYKNDGKKPAVSAVSFSDVRKYTGLQAADMLAWETYNYSLKYLATGSYPDPSAHFKHFLDNKLLSGEFYTRDRIEALVRNARPMKAAS